MATKAEIRQKVAKRLGLLGQGASLSAAIGADLDDAYDEVYDELESSGLTIWADTGSMPARCVDPFVDLCAARRITDYGVSNDRALRILQSERTALGRMKKHVATEYIPTSTRFINY